MSVTGGHRLVHVGDDLQNESYNKLAKCYRLETDAYDELERGHGYFIGFKQARSVVFRGEALRIPKVQVEVRNDTDFIATWCR